MEHTNKVRQFLLPSFTPKFFIRTAIVAIAAYLIFGYVCIPFRIQGKSMEPTYQDGEFNFYWRWAYLLSDPRRHDVVLIRFAGKRVLLLKRIVALQGEQVEFRDGTLFVDEKEIQEPYIVAPCDWNLPPRRVERGHVYVVGDNRTMPMEAHDFGQTPTTRMMGTPLW